MSPPKQNLNNKQGGNVKKNSSWQSSTSSGTSANAYNPASGTFYSLESVSDLGTSNHHGRCRSTDNSEDYPGSTGAGADYDSVSNNGSCSGESEDQLRASGKDNHGLAVGTLPGLMGNVDKKDKIRCKNERKHQRQKERRAQELKDRCNGYLMSWKLEALAHQLVAMGFSHERATMALILNEGNVEQSVVWLLEGGEGQFWNMGGNLKIDISEELARIAEIENNYKFKMADIERAIVSCEGDLGKAVDWLRSRRRNTSPFSIEDHSAPAGIKHNPGHAREDCLSLVSSASCTSEVVQTSNIGFQSSSHHPRSQDLESVNMKDKLQSTSSKVSFTVPEKVAKGRQPSRSSFYRSADWHRSSVSVDRRAMIDGTTLPTASAHTSSETYVTPIHSAANSRHGSGLGLHKVGIKTKAGHWIPNDPVLPIDLPQGPSMTASPAAITNVCSASSLSLFSPSNWNSNLHGTLMPSTAMLGKNTGDSSLKGGKSGKSSQENLSNAGSDLLGHYHPLFSTHLDAVAACWSSGRNGFVTSDNSVSLPHALGSGSHSRGSSLTSSGHYTGWGSGLPAASVDWSMGTHCDYKKIDWSMASLPSTSSDIDVWGISGSLASLKISEGVRVGIGLPKERNLQSTSGNAVCADSSIHAYDAWIGSNLKRSTAIFGLPDKFRGNQEMLLS
eukprot:c26926_g1_i1 orf=321-2339(+)